MDKEILEKILIKAVHAPSGENTQPWRFEVTNEYKVFLYCIESRDTSVYNLDNRSTYVACGALIENIDIASSAYGFRSVIQLFPRADNETCISEIIFEKISTSRNELDEYIVERYSNRETYQHTTFSHEYLASLQALHNKESLVSVHITTHKNDIKLLAKALSLNDFLALNNRYLSKFLFSHIVWDKNNPKHKKIGFQIATLGLDFADCIGLKFVHAFRFASLYRQLHVPSYVAYKSAQRIEKSSLIGCVTVTSDTNNAYIEAGRILQRTWLLATQHEYSFQVFGVPMLHRAIVSSPHKHLFNQTELDMIESMYTTIKKVYTLENEIPVIMFRQGKTQHPVEKTEKMNPRIKYL